jgi:hypothetical protein
MKSSPFCLGIAFAALLCCFVACGDDSRADRGNVGSRNEMVALRDVVPPVCFEARTSVGVEPGQVDYSVQCRSRSSHNQPAFGIGRYSLAGKSSRPGFRRIGRHPRVEGPGIVRSFGLCSRSGSVVYCSARSQGAVTVEGSIWVLPATRCEMGVSVTVPLVRRCGSEECSALGAQRVLVDGRPEGCA